jgi:suppressor for copper-sensitivity B
VIYAFQLIKEEKYKEASRFINIALQSQAKNPIFQKQAETASETSLFMLLVIALLGGLVLNFMPCVLPVLSLKVMSLIKQSKKDHLSHAKIGFFLTGLGIITSFLLLACLTIVLKESGEAFGWGIHFQNPHFLLFVFLVLVAFTASLWGVFEIDLPAGLGNFFVSHEGKGHVKDFLSGVFATLLATPCSAPFVGTALSFALSRDPSDILLVFLCLGLGFASPYFLVASLPPRFIILPKPGAWMVWTQKILGIFLALTALWIGWVLSFHLSLWTLGASTLLALAALSLFWIKHHTRPSLPAWGLALPLFAVAWGLSWVALAPSTEKATTQAQIWQPFSAEEIPTLVKQGKVVFVDVTAEWCVTCAVNKQLVLTTSNIETLLTAPNTIAMRANWTKQDGAITDFLQKYGRYGIPFNIVFGPGAPEGIPLPEILTASAVEEALQKATSRP